MRLNLPTALRTLGLSCLLLAGIASPLQSQSAWQTTSVSGDEFDGTVVRLWSAPATAGTYSFEISYNFYTIPDSIDVGFLGGNLYSSGYINGQGLLPFTINSPGVSPVGGFGLGGSAVSVVLNAAGPKPDTAWTYTFRPVSGSQWVLKSLEIEGDSTILAGETKNFTATGVFERSGASSTQRRKVSASWSAPSAGLKRVNASSPQELTVQAAFVGKDTTAQVSATYTENGVTRSASKTVSIIASPIANSPDREKAKDPNQGSDSKADKSGPVDTATGAESFYKPLLAVSGARDFEFGLNYSSSFSGITNSPVGRGWSHQYSPTLSENETTGAVTVKWSLTREHTYQLLQAGERAYYICADPGAVNNVLTKNFDNSFSISLPDQTTYQFSSSGSTRQLVKVSNSRGQGVDFAQSASRITRATEPASGAFLSFTYDSKGSLTQVTANDGRSVKLAYDNEGRLTAITDPDNQTVTYGYVNEAGAAQHKLSTVTAADGTVIYRNTYDAAGRVASQDDGLSSNRLMTFAYDEKSRPGFIITTVTDRTGAKTVYTHDAGFRLLSVVRPLGRTTTYTYDERGNRATITDPLRRVTRLQYNEAGQPIRVVAPDGSETLMEYDSRGNLIKTINALGAIATAKFDANNNPIESVDFAGNKTVRTFGANSLLTSVTTPLGNKTSYGYISGRLTSITNAVGDVTRMAYDSAGRLNKVTDADNFATDTTFTHGSRISQIKNPLGQTTSYTYDPRGRFVSTTDPLGKTTRMGYDANGNVTAVTNALGQVTLRTYDGNDRLLTETDARGNTVANTYDTAGRLVAQTDPSGKKSSFAYDLADNLLSVTDPTGAVTSTTYSVVDLPVSMRDALNATTTMTRDALGQATAVADPLKRVTTTRYDELGRPFKVTDPSGLAVESTFDSDGNLIGLSNAAGAKTEFTYDKIGRRKTLATPTKRTTTYSYNKRGLLTSMVEPSGQTSTMTYDATGRLTQRTDAVGSTSYTYDAKGRLLTVVEGGKTISRTYDDLDRLTSFRDADGNLVEYTYDPAGNLTSLKYPSGKTVTYAYDKNNRLTSVTDWAQRRTEYAYDAAGRLVLTTRPNGTSQQRGYDKAGQLIALRELGVDGRAIASYAMKFDPAGQIGSEVRTPTVAPVVPSLVSMTYDADDRLLTFDGNNITHDADGNMTRGPVGGSIGDLTYNARNLLTSAGGLTYAYDAEGRRIASTSGGSTTKFANNPNAALWQVLEIQPSTGAATLCVYGIGLIYTETGNNQPLYHHYDLRGSTVATSNQAGTVTASFAYDPYGKRTNVTGAATTPFLFVGQWGVMTDANALCFSRARYYNPASQRFINADPIGFAGGINWYSYAGSSPISQIDPSGYYLESGLDIAGIIYDLYRIGKDNIFGEKGNLGENLTSLGLNVVGLALPGATGLGTAYRGLRYADQAPDVIQSGKKFYRYVGEAEAEVIRNTGTIPNIDRLGNAKDVYFTDRYYNTASRAKDFNQLPSKPVYRVEIDPANVPNRSKFSRIDPNAHPEWGRGGGREATTRSAIPVDPNSLQPLRGAQR
jgi:RHS repeat-associated protein